MNTYTIWAVQVLSDSKDIEAESVEQALAIAEHQYQVTGELDPESVNDGAFGVTGDTEWVFNTQTCGNVAPQTEQDLDFIAEAASDFMDIMIADNEDNDDPDTAADIKKISAALERLGR